MALLLDTSAVYVPVNQQDAVQKVIGRAVKPLRVKFVGEQDGMLAFRLLDGVDNYTADEVNTVMDRVAEALAASEDETVRQVVSRATRIGIV
ncbi:MAG: hypothetical protein JWM87_1532 [Candidatus Eremiobacteraeota bacterium]|nr:hypothetical protein [Candidatus Eremiobacteraeota bacterium]